MTNIKPNIVDRWDAARRRRGPSCLSDLTLDRLAGGELGGSEAATATGHLAVCGPCAEARASLALARDAFVAEQDLSALAADALARAGSRAEAEPRSRWRRLVAALGLCAGAATAFVLYGSLTGPQSPSGGPSAGADDRRTKGSLTLGLYVQHPETGAEGTLHLGEPLHPGDRLRFRVTSQLPGHVAVLGIDQTGAVSVYHPQPAPQPGARSADVSRAAPLEAGSRAPLPSAVELDDTLGDEVVLAVRCADPLPLARIVAAARDAGLGGAELPLPCAQTRYRITKVERQGSPARPAVKAGSGAAPTP